MSACEQKVVRLHNADHALAGQPYLDFSENGCSLCGVCADVCPLGIDRDGLAPSLPAIDFRTDVCLTHNGVICLSCVGHCASRALRLQLGGRVVLDEDNCIGCGACVSICPVEAIRVVSFDASPAEAGTDRP
ncbi:MAG: 4Fe-4S dicluster domain-containing protein [Chromatiales bacterium]|nr:4Fe-4S dicluster domain-containing protein [Chromatiales bacterium]